MYRRLFMAMNAMNATPFHVERRCCLRRQQMANDPFTLRLTHGRRCTGWHTAQNAILGGFASRSSGLDQ